MGLLVKSLIVRDFRSYEEFLLELADDLTILVGPNGVGKTNLIEALQTLTTTQSFRKPQWADVVRWGREQAYASLEAEGDSRHVSLEMIVQASGRREFRVNGKTRRRLLDVAGILPCVVFTPEDLRLIKDSAERRRNAIDGVGSQLSPSYAQLSVEYERIVRQRNALLRDEGASEQDIEPWTDALITTGARFREARERLFQRMRPHVQAAYEEIAGVPIEVEYQPSHQRDGISAEGDSEEVLRLQLEKRAREERARRTTLTGPHRDEIVFRLEGKEARLFASQGQQRTIALAWKLAEVAVVKEVSGQPPLLLLDDVMSELDERRRHSLALAVGTVAQTVVTTANIGYFDQEMVKRARVVTLS